jgi:hypothetical protein
VHADHGSSYTLDWAHPERTNMAERFPILYAMYAPGLVQGNVCPVLTPVNTYPFLFSRLWGNPIPFQEDSSFFSSWGSPYRYVFRR